jgi:hypothetical protein
VGKQLNLKNEMHQKYKKATENEISDFTFVPIRNKTNRSLFDNCVKIAFWVLVVK